MGMTNLFVLRSAPLLVLFVAGVGAFTSATVYAGQLEVIAALQG